MEHIGRIGRRSDVMWRRIEIQVVAHGGPGRLVRNHRAIGRTPQPFEIRHRPRRRRIVGAPVQPGLPVRERAKALDRGNNGKVAGAAWLAIERNVMDLRRVVEGAADVDRRHGPRLGHGRADDAQLVGAGHRAREANRLHGVRPVGAAASIGKPHRTGRVDDLEVEVVHECRARARGRREVDPRKRHVQRPAGLGQRHRHGVGRIRRRSDAVQKPHKPARGVDRTLDIDLSPALDAVRRRGRDFLLRAGAVLPRRQRPRAANEHGLDQRGTRVREAGARHRILPHQQRGARRKGRRHAGAAVEGVVRALLRDTPPGTAGRNARPARDDVGARGGDLGLDAAVCRRPAAGERSHALNIGVRRRAPGDPVVMNRIDRVVRLPRAGSVLVRRVPAAPRRPVVLAGADGQHVLRGRGGAHASGIDHAVRVAVEARVARRKDGQMVGVVPGELVGLPTAVGILAGHIGTPTVGMHARPGVVRLEEEIIDVVAEAREAAVGPADRLVHEFRAPSDAPVATAAHRAVAGERTRGVRTVAVEIRPVVRARQREGGPDTPAEVRMDPVGRADVEAGVCVTGDLPCPGEPPQAPRVRGVQVRRGCGKIVVETRTDVFPNPLHVAPPRQRGHEAQRDGCAHRPPAPAGGDRFDRTARGTNRLRHARRIGRREGLDRQGNARPGGLRRGEVRDERLDAVRRLVRLRGEHGRQRGDRRACALVEFDEPRILGNVAAHDAARRLDGCAMGGNGGTVELDEERPRVARRREGGGVRHGCAVGGGRRGAVGKADAAVRGDIVARVGRGWGKEGAFALQTGCIHLRLHRRKGGGGHGHVPFKGGGGRGRTPWRETVRDGVVQRRTRQGRKRAREPGVPLPGKDRRGPPLPKEGAGKGGQHKDSQSNSSHVFGPWIVYRFPRQLRG